jgi:hypothetical protein
MLISNHPLYLSKHSNIDTPFREILHENSDFFKYLKA